MESEDGKQIHFISKMSRSPPAITNPTSKPIAIMWVVSGEHLPDEFIEYPGTQSLQVAIASVHTAHLASAQGLQLDVRLSSLYPVKQRKQEYCSAHSSHPALQLSHSVPFIVVLA
jgi:hypothetical protein